MNLARYRRHFRSKVIPKHYSARVHITLFALFEVAALVITGLWVDWNRESPVWMVVSVAWASSALYLVHRFMLHRKLPGFAWAHKMHHWHHTFYQSFEMEYDQLDDVYMLLMPPWLQATYFLVYLPLVAWLLSQFLPATFVPHLVFTLTLWYGLYEVIHWVEHLPDTHPVMRQGWARAMKRHHVIHHHPKHKDSRNFGIVEPSQDYLWGSKL
jgi:hypothetical protein